ncbi:nephrin-like [Procambarus clarkii]|uniref:nephrin-like n=1 Tax=Procambarus clarkii TaxID=6728 RepID=UPI003744705B
MRIGGAKQWVPPLTKVVRGTAGLHNYAVSRLTLVFIACSAICLSQGSATEFQKFRMTPHSVEVKEGEDVFLQCAVDNQQGKAQWTKDGFALGFERHVPGYPRYYYTGDPLLGEHHLVISGVTLTEDGEYQCQVGPTITSPPIWAAANVTVILAPTSVSIVGWADGAVVEVMAGTSLTLECLVADARPAPRAAWFKGGLEMDSDLQEDRLEASRLPRRWSSRSQLVVSATGSDDGKMFSCLAVHPALPQDPADPASLAASITLSVLHPPGHPTIIGYETGEVLLAGMRRTLSCRVSGGNPRPWVLWYREGRLLDDTTAVDATGVYNAYEVVVTAEEDGAVYECSVTNDLLLENPLTANVTLTVYYAPRMVSITGPSQVEEGKTLDLTCTTSVSNPPASLSWSVAGETIEETKTGVERREDGGWVTSSQLTRHPLGRANATEVVVECRAVNPAVEHVVKKIKIITITKPPGVPVFEDDLQREVIAGTTLQVTCTTTGGHPPPTVRIYKESEALLTELQREGNLTRARAEVELSPGDNGAKVTCDASTSPHTAPLTTSVVLTVLFAPWEVRGFASPSTVEEGEMVIVSCESSSSLPPSNITWSSEGVVLEAASTYTSKGVFGGTTTRSELRIETRAGDNGRVLMCTAGNGLDKPVHREIVLDVLHTPIWLSKPPDHLDVYEGADLVITAAAASNPGPVRYL